MSKQVTFTIEEIDSFLHSLHFIGRTYYLIDEEDTKVEEAFRDNNNEMPKELFPLLSWTNERMVIPYEIIEHKIRKLIENKEGTTIE